MPARFAGMAKGTDNARKEYMGVSKGREACPDV